MDNNHLIYSGTDGVHELLYQPDSLCAKVRRF